MSEITPTPGKHVAELRDWSLEGDRLCGMVFDHANKENCPDGFPVRTSTIVRNHPNWAWAETQNTVYLLREREKTEPRNDPVNHPSHYTQGSVECIDAIASALGEDGFVAFLRGQVIKYNWRLEHKSKSLEDAEKGQWYQNRLILALKARQKV